MTEPDDVKKRINELLQRWSSGDPTALNDLIPLVYKDLRRIAGYLFSGERKNHTLQPTAVVSLAFIKLKHSTKVECRDGAHFLALYARAMRQILIDYARKHNADKRHGETVPLDEVQLFSRERNKDMLAIAEAMDLLAKSHPRQASVVDLRVFCGLNNPQIAEVLQISPNTVIRDWRDASDWLRRAIEKKGSGGEAA